MNISRRDFMKVFGVSVASLLLSHCNQPPTPESTATPTQTPIRPTCYTATPIPPTPQFTPLPTSIPALQRLRLCWLRFDDLARQTAASPDENFNLVNTLIADHRLAMDEYAARSDFSTGARDLVQEAYEAAVYHVWRLNVRLSCYTSTIVDYYPASAQTLIQQAELLSRLSAQNNVDASTLEKVRLALEHDLAFYALTSQEVGQLYDRLIRDYMDHGTPVPAFQDLQLALTPDVTTATEFIINLLSGK
jgi:hypothetical protein